ncbi:hypothetical protein KCU95_g6956, partial [Aureobasidium melanogenum]
MASTKPSSSEGAKELKKLQGDIKLMNRSLRLKINKAYIYKFRYLLDSRAGLEHKIKALVKERDKLKEKKLKLKKRERKLHGQKQDLKAKILDLKIAYRDLRHNNRDEDVESSSCSESCCYSSEEDSFDEDSVEKDSSEEN